MLIEGVCGGEVRGVDVAGHRSASRVRLEGLQVVKVLVPLKSIGRRVPAPTGLGGGGGIESEVRGCRREHGGGHAALQLILHFTSDDHRVAVSMVRVVWMVAGVQVARLIIIAQ